MSDPEGRVVGVLSVDTAGAGGEIAPQDRYSLEALARVAGVSISRLRALEFSRPMVRATNTGATAIIDHEGRVAQQLERLTRGVLEGPVDGREGTTPYAWWVSRAGLWPLWGLGLLLAALAWRHARRRQDSM